MTEKQTYKTGTRNALVKYMAQHPDRQFTADALCVAINGDAECRKSSIYRHIAALCEDGILQKTRSENGDRNVYQYVGELCDCGSHFHEKCLRCGSLHHLKCVDSLRFAEHLLAEHGFSVNCGQSILYGICAECRKKEGAAAQ
ncbi:MAG: hypothetical protein E7666_06660 [Ruminococcaceae bacterium]|nr:hypothetical protein [Oscillospiraceae bacterium]